MQQPCSKAESTLSISQMAKTFHISRQTLIHYDHIGLFKPSYLDEHGYRFYCPCQLPKLREITLLKRMGMKLEMIKVLIEECNPTDFVQHLTMQKKFLDEEINRLNQYRHHLDDRLSLFSKIDQTHIQLNEPFLDKHEQRFYMFQPFPVNQELNHELVDTTFMQLWDHLLTMGSYHSHGFGVLLRLEYVKQADHFNQAGVFILLDETEVRPESCLTLKAGVYVSMYKYGMPYDHRAVESLLSWINDQGYIIDGDMVDLCIVDHIYNKNDNNDFCLLQIPIRNE